MPHLRERSGSNGACPDSATVLAVIEGEADEWLRSAYAQHLSHCSACLDLDSRLRNFDRPVITNEKEWEQTEKRLDNWMGAFLDSKPLAVAQPTTENLSAQPGFRKSSWKPGLIWKLSLATALLALAAVGVDVYLRFQPEQVQVPAIVPPPPPPAEPAVPAGGVPRSGPMAEAPLAAPPAQTTEQKETVAKAQPPSEPQQQAATKPAPRPPEQIAKPSTAGTEQTAVATTVKPNPAVPAKPQVQTEVVARAEKPAPTTTASAVRPGTAAAPRSGTPNTARPPAATGPAMENVAIGRQPSHAGVQAPPPAVNLPASLRLAAGARLWLSLESFNFQEDGRVIFHGSLLLPLNSTGSSALEHGTEVSGSVTSAAGQTSVLLSEIVVHGAHYKLKSQAGAGNARTSGSGGAVQFDSGKVLEMWVSADSIYERVRAD